MSYNTRSSVVKESNIKPSTVGGTTGATKEHADNWNEPSKKFQADENVGSRQGKFFEEDSPSETQNKGFKGEQADETFEVGNRQDTFFNQKEHTASDKDNLGDQNEFDSAELDKEFSIEDE